jgi:primary-amine oxidase
MTHITRPEEFPIMSVAKAGFRLVPVGFFSRNPALDVPE